MAGFPELSRLGRATHTRVLERSGAAPHVLHRRGRMRRSRGTAPRCAASRLARAYFFAKSELSAEEKERRKALFGSFSDALRPVKPYRWTLAEESLLELPVTTMPLFKTPIHFSYLIYLASLSELAARCILAARGAHVRNHQHEPFAVAASARLHRRGG